MRSNRSAVVACFRSPLTPAGWELMTSLTTDGSVDGCRPFDCQRMRPARTCLYSMQSTSRSCFSWRDTCPMTWLGGRVVQWSIHSLVRVWAGVLLPGFGAAGGGGLVEGEPVEPGLDVGRHRRHGVGGEWCGEVDGEEPAPGGEYGPLVGEQVAGPRVER